VEAELQWLESTTHIDHVWFMITLPKLGKWLDKCLSSDPGVIPYDPPEVRDRSGDLVISQVGGTYLPFLDSLFWESGPFCEIADYSALDPSMVLMARQYLYMFKKYAKACPTMMIKIAVDKFWSIDRELRVPRSIDNDLFFHPVGGSYETGLTGDEPTALTRMVVLMDKLALWLAPGSDLDVNDLVPSHGPGSCSDLVTDGGDKYTFPSYPRVIQGIIPASYVCSVNWRLDSEARHVAHKTAACLTAVPKSLDKPRLIASEPVVHQYLQQGLMGWYRKHLHPVLKMMVSFVDQQPSRDAALKASKDGNCATIDLSSASDRLSLWSVESQFQHRPFLLEALIGFRSSFLHDPILTGDQVELRKFAPQGNATTFPVQSTIYACAALAAGLVWNGHDAYTVKMKHVRSMAKRIRVFGDDIISPREHVPYLGLLLQYLELKVNSEKSHVSGYFRESCGMDAYRGYDVTPAYVSHRTPTRPGDNFVAYVEQSNNAHRKGFFHLAALMAELIPSEMQEYVPVSRQSLGCVSLFSFVNETFSRRRKYSKNLWRHEVRGFTLESRTRVERRESQADLLQYFLEKPSPTSKWKAGNRSAPRVKLKLEWVDARSTNRPRSDFRTRP
jgi:hypothetical protein